MLSIECVPPYQVLGNSQYRGARMSNVTANACLAESHDPLVRCDADEHELAHMEGLDSLDELIGCGHFRSRYTQQPGSVSTKMNDKRTERFHYRKIQQI